MTQILILKTGALGDVLRTTSILPGLAERYSQCQVTWVTAPGAVDLVRLHPLVSNVVALDTSSNASMEAVRARLAKVTWDRLLSFDDEEPLCRLASQLTAKRVSGAFMDAKERRRYTPDVAPWFDMGLLSVHGKAVADRMKIENRRTHSELYAEMLGIAPGKPALPREPASERFAEGFARRTNLLTAGPVIGLNTGAGGRWQSKTLTPERTAEVAVAVGKALAWRVTFLLFGGPGETERNAEIADRLTGSVRLVDAGCDNSILDFSALVSQCALLLTSDSLALHIALARDVRVVVFFAPTSAAEIELYGLGEKVVSTAPDYCTYRPDTDTSTLTVERIRDAVLRQLPRN